MTGRAPRRPVSAPTTPPRVLPGRRAPKLTSGGGGAPLFTLRRASDAGAGPGFRGDPEAPVVRRSPQVWRGILGRGRGWQRPRTWRPWRASGCHCLCSALCRSPLRALGSDGVWSREEGRRPRLRDPRDAGPEPIPRLSLLLLFVLFLF